MTAIKSGTKLVGDTTIDWWMFPPMTEEQFLEMREDRSDWQQSYGGPGAAYNLRAVGRFGKYRTLVTVRSGVDV